MRIDRFRLGLAAIVFAVVAYLPGHASERTMIPLAVPLDNVEPAPEAVDAEFISPAAPMSLAVSQTCLQAGGFTTSFRGENRFRGNFYRIDSDVRLRRISMLLDIPAGFPVDLIFSIHYITSGDETPVFTRYTTDIVVTDVGVGVPVWYSMPEINQLLRGGRDYMIGVAWEAVAVRYGRDGINYTGGVSFLHGEVLGHAAVNLTVPLDTEMELPVRFNGVHQMELCFDSVKGACCDPTTDVCQLRFQFGDPGDPVAGDCLDERAHFFGERTTCADVICEFGSCCMPCNDDLCKDDYTPEACDAIGGVNFFPGSFCPVDEASLCPPIMGACCDGTGGCSVVCEADCTAAEGTYRGDETDCLPNFCEGACCVQSFCLNTTQTLCTDFEGTHKGNGTTCATLLPENECGGACCWGPFLGASLEACVHVDSRDRCTFEHFPVSAYRGDNTDCEFAEGEDCDSVATYEACCLPDGSCINTTSQFCTAPWVNGQALGVGEPLCHAGSCDFARGACCIGDGPDDCSVQFADSCLINNGVYHGDGTSCEPDLCVPTGVCCGLLVGDCKIKTEAACDLDGNNYLGDDTVCGDPFATCLGLGACCGADSTCQDQVSEARCDLIGGAYRGNGVLCVDVTDCDQRGACCASTGTCLYILEAECDDIAGVFATVGEICTLAHCPSGACCFEEVIEDVIVNVCDSRTPEACALEQSGVYQGNDTECEPQMCAPGACCQNDGSCDFVLASDCDDEFNRGIECVADACFNGACCEDGGCSEMTLAACAFSEGVFHGASSVCRDTICVEGSCCDELDGSCTYPVVEAQCSEDTDIFRPAENCAQSCQLLGACCLGSGICSDEEFKVKRDCELAGGIFTAGATCPVVPACSPHGACCFGGGCSDESSESCSALGGVYQGDGEICAAGMCTLGSCCEADFSCLDNRTASQCSDSGGFFRQGETCANGDACDQRGSCCFEDGVCIDSTFPADCAANGGSFTEGGDCALVECVRLGACCIDGACSQVGRVACEAAGGVFEGEGTPCTGGLCNLGSCCHADGACDDDQIESQCQGADASWGFETCGGITCGRGACCTAISGCVNDLSATECNGVGGIYDGDGTTCTPLLCSSGACCAPDGETCEIGKSFQDCRESGGVYQGANSACDDGCVTGSCCGLIGDGSGICSITGPNACPNEDLYTVGGTCAAAGCETMGSCCYDDLGVVTCEVLTLDACGVKGGSHGGNGTTCETPDGLNDTCVVAACCLGIDNCIPVSRRTCGERGGIYRPGVTDCGAVDVCDSGSCCALDGTCTDDEFEATCVDPESVFTLGATCTADSCDPQGACCELTVCSIKTEGQCLLDGGVYLEHGTLCGTDVCSVLGACCDSESSVCQNDVFEADCVGLSEEWTQATLCADLNPACDGAATGACCDGASCSISTEAACVGTYLGDATDCSGDPCITITGSDPPDCSIDARQPSEPDLTALAGWDSFTLTFDGDVSAMTAADFIVELVPGGVTIPGIDSVTIQDPNTILVQLDQMIPTRQWTCVRHVASGSRACLGYLPSDVDANGTSSAGDILNVIDNLNGVVIPSYPMWQCDADRSGVCGASDILRVIDLLNGASDYDVWLGESIGGCPNLP